MKKYKFKAVNRTFQFFRTGNRPLFYIPGRTTKNTHYIKQHRVRPLPRPGGRGRATSHDKC